MEKRVVKRLLVYGIVAVLVIGILLFVKGYNPLAATQKSAANPPVSSSTPVAAATTGTTEGTATSTYVNTTATAQAMATAAAAQQIYNQATSGTPTIDDPLSTDDGDLVQATDKYGNSCAFTGGAYHITLPRPLFWTWCNSNAAGAVNNFALQVQVNILKGDQGGIIFDNISNTHLYKIYLNPGGTYILYVMNNEQAQTTLQFSSSPAIKTGLNQPNLMTVIMDNNNFYLYVNNQFVTSVPLSDYRHGMIGLTAGSVSQATDVVFSDMKIWTF